MCGWIALPADRRRSQNRCRAFAHIDDGANQFRSCWHAPTTGADVPLKPSARQMRRARVMKQPRAILTAYYGQLARISLAATESNCARPRPFSPPRCARRRRTRAAPPTCCTRSANATPSAICRPISAKQSSDVTCSSARRTHRTRRNDARAMLEIGKPSLGRGLPLDHYAFPTIGDIRPTPASSLPKIRGAASIYSVARTETRSTSATGLRPMRGRPDAGDAGSGRDTANASRSATTGTGWSPIPSNKRRWAPPNSAR